MNRRALIALLIFTVSPGWAKTKADHPLAARRLEEILQLSHQGRWREALKQAQQLSLDFPGYPPAQAVYGDLLALHSGRVAQVVAQTPHEPLQPLRHELDLRRRASQNRPLPNTLPSQVQSLAAHTKTLLVIDTAKARLYALTHTAGRVTLEADYYVSVGRFGVGKKVEGDEKTPHGVYAVTRRIGQKELKDSFFGAGALPINYPNPYDRQQGRTGFGIWLHGSPKGQPSRPVFSTNGCIVLADSDMQAILDWTEPYATPVIVGENLVWKPLQSSRLQAQAAASTVVAWACAQGTMRASFDSPKLHRFERDMVRYEFLVAGQWQALNRQGQPVAQITSAARPSS